MLVGDLRPGGLPAGFTIRFGLRRSKRRALFPPTANGRSVEIDEGSNLLDTDHQAGVHVPRGSRKRGASTAGLRDPGPRIQPHNPKAPQGFWEPNMQWLLTRHPNDCMRCEAKVNCQLHGLASDFTVVEDEKPVEILLEKCSSDYIKNFQAT